jgi:surfeit locus 1 family protein
VKTASRSHAPLEEDPRTRGPRFLLTRRWVIGHIVVLVIVAGCVTAGFWQVDRLHQRRASNARIEAQLSKPPVSLTSLLHTSGSDRADALAYRRVRVDGRYDTRREVVLIGRTLGEDTGNNLLTPLELPDGRGLIVNRGWVPYVLQTPPVPQALPPAGEVELTGVLLPSESEAPARSGSEPLTEMVSIDIPQLQAQTPYRLEPVSLWLQSQRPAQSESLPRVVQLPALSEGPHLSYAIQWFTFATIGVIGYPLLLRREIRRPRVPAEEPSA